MKRLCVALCTALLTTVPGIATAQSEGALIVRGNDEYAVAWLEFDGNHTWVISSNYPDFGCGLAAAGTDSWQIVATPVGAQHFREHGLLFTRVYHATPAEFREHASPPVFVCEHPYVAEGILSFLKYDNQTDPAAPGANVWGHVLNGTLRDLVGACRSGMVKVDVLHLWSILPHADFPACAPGCVKVRVSKGPTAECVNSR